METLEKWHQPPKTMCQILFFWKTVPNLSLRYSQMFAYQERVETTSMENDSTFKSETKWEEL